MTENPSGRHAAGGAQEAAVQTYVLGCDNAAVQLKNTLKALLRQAGIEVEDKGVNSPEVPDNYPGIAARVCRAVIESGYRKRGVLLCGTGIGMAMSANKFRGIRAAVCHDSYSAERSVLSNNANVLCIGARVIGPELAKKILAEWIALTFKDGPSTEKVEEIRAIEAENMK